MRPVVRHTDVRDASEVAEALRAAGLEADASTRRRAEYSSDASLYRVVPLAVAFPRDADGVAATVETCRSLGVPLTARSGGTSIAGNAVGPGVVLDSGRYLRHIQSLDPEARTATVEPGVVLDDLQAAAASHGLRFGPDPSTHDRCGIGGMIGNNACGSRALGYGRTVDHVRELDLVAGTGDRLRLASGQDPPVGPGTGGTGLLAAAARVGRTHEEAIRRELGRFTRQISGYGLHHLLPEHGSDVARALVGSEGTCAVLASATVDLVPVPPATVLVVLGYADMASAADAVPGLLGRWPVAGAGGTEAAGLTAVEGLDRRIVDVVRARRGAGAVPALPGGDGWLFVELAGSSAAALRAAAERLARDAEPAASLAVTDPEHARALWRIREDGSGLVTRAGPEPAHAGWEDAAVPPERLGDYLRAFEDLLEAHGLAGVPYGHFGDGCVHVRITFPLGRPGGNEVFRAFLVEAAGLVARHGGSLSGEHGDGRARSELLRYMYSARILAAFADFKATFDPEGILNPGVIVRPAAPDADLRADHQRPLTRGLAFAYGGDVGDFSSAVHRCIGIGRCRSGAGTGDVMCPSYVATGDEKDSTRGRARVLQEMVTGSAVTGGWRSEEVHEALDLCLACKGCLSDCPTGVDMATYKAEVLHQTYRRRPRPASHYTLGWLPRWARMASVAPGLASRLLQGRLAGGLAKRLGGIDPRRPLPAFAARTFESWLAGHRPPADAAGRPPVVLWADTFTNRFTPEVGVAAVRVLEDAGFAVRGAPRGLCCGLTWISTGQLDTARRRLRRTVGRLQAEVAGGVPLVGLEPSCTAVLRSDALELLGPGDEAARAVASATRTLAEVLTGHAPRWSPPRLDGLRAVAQPHCHHHAVMGWGSDRALLEACGAEVVEVGGCCGLAGNFGMERGHHDVSVAVAGNELLPALREHEGATTVLADGFSCRTQVDYLTGRPGLHLAQLLAGHLDRRAAGPDGQRPTPTGR